MEGLLDVLIVVLFLPIVDLSITPELVVVCVVVTMGMEAPSLLDQNLVVVVVVSVKAWISAACVIVGNAWYGNVVCDSGWFDDDAGELEMSCRACGGSGGGLNSCVTVPYPV